MSNLCCRDNGMNPLNMQKTTRAIRQKKESHKNVSKHKSTQNTHILTRKVKFILNCKTTFPGKIKKPLKLCSHKTQTLY